MPRQLTAQAALLLSLLVGRSVQQDGQAGVYWLFPKTNEKMTYHHNDVVNVTWTSSFASPILITYCRGANGKGVDTAKQMDVPGGNASVLVELDYTHADTDCWFDLKPDLEGGKGSNSQSFAYVSEVGDEATIGLLSTSTAKSSTDSSSTATTAATITTPASAGSNSQTSATRTNLLITSTSSATSVPTTAASGEASNSSSGGLSVGAQAGIGVGVGVAAIGIGALAILMCVRRRRRGIMTDEKSQPLDSSPTITGSGAYVSPQYQASEYGGSTTVHSYSPTAPLAHVVEPASASKYVFPPAFAIPHSERHEMESSNVPQELQGSQYPVSELATPAYR
ncbi:hypothetical protein BKA67DRAFT_654153 [Truncatella angustata]|uniref:Uncharacterized protein n=1 Tax=Truncatella angustata TaxID=152316 RepID=A0A9P9A2R6_9PEZI|nr:uncharacterized protein BKA67DRAFT_654153 [Truncatella angustata]KAH6661006.1 hypothetical protein BKA67DRAFT_654153 [Truncatella angustata]